MADDREVGRFLTLRKLYLKGYLDVKLKSRKGGSGGCVPRSRKSFVDLYGHCPDCMGFSDLPGLALSFQDPLFARVRKLADGSRRRPSSPAISRDAPNDQTAITHDATQCGPHAVVGEIHIIEIQMLSVAPDLIERHILVLRWVLECHEKSRGSRRNQICRAPAINLRWAPCATWWERGADGVEHGGTWHAH